MTLAPIIVFFLVRFLRKTLKTFSPDPYRDKFLFRALIGIGVLFIAEVSLSISDYTVWAWHLVLLAIILITFKLDVLIPARRVMIGVIPLSALLFLGDLLEALFNGFYKKVDNYFDMANAIAITWMVAMIIVSNKQVKALEKERRERLEEEERHKFIEAQKLELEQQVAERTLELTQQKEQLENTLMELNATQKQLIQSEKMASLGELTAGIAHEIQNPLNFVNNFSEVSVELISEMEEELKAGNKKEVLEIAKDLEKQPSEDFAPWKTCGWYSKRNATTLQEQYRCKRTYGYKCACR